MARGGLRKGAGRKPGKTKKVAVLARLAPEIRQQIERYAKWNRRSLSAEIESRLRDTMLPRPDDQTRALTYVVAQIVAILRMMVTQEAKTMVARKTKEPFDWRTNRFDFEALKGAIVNVLDQLAPDSEIESGRLAQYETPSVAAVVAEIIMIYLGSEEQLEARGHARGAHVGSMYYAFPQAARDLKLTTKK